MRAEVVLLVSLTAFIPASLTVAVTPGPQPATRFASSRPGEIVVSVTVGGLGPFRFLLDTRVDPHRGDRQGWRPRSTPCPRRGR